MAAGARGRGAGAGGPAVVLVRPQLGENIGTAARAMLNFGLTDLRLVAPRDGWPNVKAVNAASGATAVLDRVRLFATVAEAVADLHRVYATTARPREMLLPVVTPRRAVRDMRAEVAAGAACGVLFGPERTGLDNDAANRADVLVTVPANPEHASLNLAQAVLLLAYEWFQAGADAPEAALPESRTPPATHAELENFFAHLERELDASDFLRNREMRPVMLRNIRALFLRAGLRVHEVQTLHGIVTALVKRAANGGR